MHIYIHTHNRVIHKIVSSIKNAVLGYNSMMEVQWIYKFIVNKKNM